MGTDLCDRASLVSGKRIRVGGRGLVRFWYGPMELRDRLGIPPAWPERRNDRRRNFAIHAEIDSGSSSRKGVEVQVLSSAPKETWWSLAVVRTKLPPNLEIPLEEIP